MARYKKQADGRYRTKVKLGVDSRGKKAVKYVSGRTIRELALHVGNTHEHGLLLLVLYYTGVRRGEALGLQWRDIDFKNRTVHIQRDIDFIDNGAVGDLKSKAANSVIPILNELCRALNAVRGIGESFVFTAPVTGKQLSLSTYRRRWTQLMTAMWECDNSIESVPIKAKEKRRSILKAHHFRHNYASILYDAGIDVLSAMKWLGHNDVKTTLAIYSHL